MREEKRPFLFSENDSCYSSENNLLLANNKAENLTIKRLIRNNPTMAQKFAELAETVRSRAGGVNTLAVPSGSQDKQDARSWMLYFFSGNRIIIQHLGQSGIKIKGCKPLML